MPGKQNQAGAIRGPTPQSESGFKTVAWNVRDAAPKHANRAAGSRTTMVARSCGGLPHPLGFGELGVDGVEAFEAGGADVVGVAGLPGEPTPALSVAGDAIGAATEHPIRRSGATTSTVRPRFIDFDLEVQTLDSPS